MSGLAAGAKNYRTAAVGLLATVGLGGALLLGQNINLWISTVPVGVAIVITAVVGNEALPSQARLNPAIHNTVIGVIVGLGLAGLTWLIYPLAAELAPGIESQVRRLYSRLAISPGAPWSLALLFIVVLAEELAFREVLLDSLVRRHGQLTGSALTLCLYALPQLGSDELIMVPVALALGTIWTAQRLMSGSLWMPLATHFTWSSLVLELFPLISGS